MIRLLTTASIAALVLGAVPVHAIALRASGTLSIEFGSVASLPVAGSGTVLANGSGGGAHLDTLSLPAGLFEGDHLVAPFTDPAVQPIGGVQLTVSNEAGSISAGAGPIGLNGYVRVCLFGACSAAVANLFVPLQPVGEGGYRLITASVNLTVIGAPWTTGTVAVGSITRMGFARGPASGASSTALSSGQIRLVTPIFISTNNPATRIVSAFGVLGLHFVPEPATLALLGGGLALLAAAGRARLARARSAAHRSERTGSFPA